MCGINGIVQKNKNPNIESQIKRMNELIVHRGPDDNGYSCFDGVALGMQRLSIIDLSTGHQPMFSDDSQITIVFNGEIYNYLEIKEKLIKMFGVRFNTQSDTEVVLKGYEVWGEDVLQYLNGMFAFSIFDKKRNKVFIARDRFGEKPLYFFKGEDEILWASELKSIIDLRPELKKISKSSLNLFLTLTYIPAPHTIYENVYKLRPGHYALIDIRSFTLIEQAYWDIDLEKSVEITNYQKAKEKIRTILFDSVKTRMSADVPLGIFLSGGVDSTIIAAIMSKISDVPIKTFSIGYSNPRYDETERARLVAEHIGSDHHEYRLDYTEVLDELEKVILNFDEPFADSSCIPTYFVSKQTVNHVKVALTGDGGDEVFGGYNKYLIHSFGKLYNDLVPKPLKNLILGYVNRLSDHDTKGYITKIKKLLKSVGSTVTLNHLNIISLGFQNEDLKRLVRDELYFDMQENLIDFSSLSGKDLSVMEPLKLARYIDKNVSLEGDMLTKVDRASMLCSLECRAPFLDHRLMELSYCIPDSFLIRGNNKKRILKDTFKDLLPKDFFINKKSGFEIPVSDWFRNELKDDLIDTLSEENLNSHSFFSNTYVHHLIHEHISKDIDNSFKLWTLFCFQKWYNYNFNS
jgi:asparagine synthase (glutamine-hydrolysing)